MRLMQFNWAEIVLNFIWSTTCAQYTFINFKPKMCFNVTIDEDCMIFE